MYGYIVPEKSTLSQSDFVLYRSFYCGMCCQTGKLYGQLPRFTTNYEFAFLSALLHDYACSDIIIEEHTCVLNPVKKKAVLMPDPLLERVCAANILLSYQKALDGIADGDGFKYRASRAMLKRAFTRAQKAYPAMWTEIERSYAVLSAVEKSNTKSIDRAADPFACLMAILPSYIIGRETDDNLKILCYNIGKFVYLADALDDITDDFGAKRYNPFLAAYGGFTNRKEFIAAHRADLEFCFAAVCARAQNALDKLTFSQSRSLIRNIVCDGMRKKAEELLGSAKKLPPPRI